MAGPNAANATEANREAPTFDLRPFIRAVTAGSRWILLGLIVGLIGGASAWLASGRKYEAVVTLVVNPSRGMQQAGVPTQFRALVENYSVVAEVLAAAGLDKGDGALTPRTFLERAMAVEDIRGTNLLRLRVRLKDPVQAAAIANDVARRAVLLSRSISEEEGATLRDQLKTVRDEALERLRTAETVLLTFKRANQVDFAKSQFASLLKSREDMVGVEIDLAAEQARVLAAEREQQSRPPTLSFKRSIESSPALTEAARTQTNGDLRGLLGLEVVNQESNPVFERIDGELALARAKVAELARKHQQLESLSAKSRTSGQAADLYEKVIELSRLEDDQKLSRRVYEDVAMRYEQARSLVTSASSQLQIVDAAIPSHDVVSWPIWIWLAIGAVAGVLLPAVSILTLTAVRLIGGAMGSFVDA
jgi:uncharacterized protein involved in exopolysaccharide biosynthesis